MSDSHFPSFGSLASATTRASGRLLGCAVASLMIWPSASAQITESNKTYPATEQTIIADPLSISTSGSVVVPDTADLIYAASTITLATGFSVAEGGSFSTSDDPASFGDLISPSVPTGLTKSNESFRSFDLDWNTATDNVAVTVYEVQRDGETHMAVSTNSALVQGLPGSTSAITYSMKVRAGDAAGNWSDWSAPLSVTTVADTVAPGVPSGLSASYVSAEGFYANWVAPLDNDEVSHYEIIFQGGDEREVFGESILFSDLTPNVSHTFKVRAHDRAGNTSPWTSAVSVTTVSNTAQDTDSDDIPDVLENDTTGWALEGTNTDTSSSAIELNVTEPTP